MTNPHSYSNVADYLRHAAHQAWNVDGIADDLPRRNIERVGIIGGRPAINASAAWASAWRFAARPASI